LYDKNVDKNIQRTRASTSRENCQTFVAIIEKDTRCRVRRHIHSTIRSATTMVRSRYNGPHKTHNKTFPADCGCKRLSQRGGTQTPVILHLRPRCDLLQCLLQRLIDRGDVDEQNLVAATYHQQQITKTIFRS